MNFFRNKQSIRIKKTYDEVRMSDRYLVGTINEIQDTLVNFNPGDFAFQVKVQDNLYRMPEVTIKAIQEIHDEIPVVAEIEVVYKTIIPKGMDPLTKTFLVLGLISAVSITAFFYGINHRKATETCIYYDNDQILQIGTDIFRLNSDGSIVEEDRILWEEEYDKLLKHCIHKKEK